MISRRGALALAALLLVAAALRIAAVLTIGNLPRVHGDEWQYASAALSLARGHGFPGSFRPPVYPLFLAIAFRLFGESLTAARLAQVPLGLATILLVFDLVRRRFGERAGLLSALIVALHPTLITYTHFLWSETLVATLLVLAVWSLDRFAESRAPGWLALAGVVLGVASLAREMIVYLLPIAVVWSWSIAGTRRQHLRRAALLVLATVAVIAPWTIRNSLVQGRFVLISNARWAPIAEGLLHDPEGMRSRREVAKEFRRALRSYSNDVEREDFARRRAVELLAHPNPRWLLGKLWSGPVALLSVESQLSRFAEHGWLRPGDDATVRVLIAVEALYYVAATALGVVGLWLVPGGRVKSFVVATLFFFLAIHTIAFSTNRYRVPLLPLLALYAGPLLCGLTVPRAVRARRTAGAAASLAVLLAIFAASYRQAQLRPPAGHGPGAAQAIGRALDE